MRPGWTPTAFSDLRSLREDIARDPVRAAYGMVEGIEAAAAVLVRNPEAGRRGRVQGTRELVIAGTPYLLVYRVWPTRVQILAVLHAARKWPAKFG